MEELYIEIENKYILNNYRKKYTYHMNDKYFILDDINYFKILYSYKQRNKKGCNIGKIKTKLNYNKKLEYIIHELTYA